jgi:2-polyprenyl-3-methyl-5-hydroxy-6-metoxy-1,4-benzoquinol methylase
MDRYVIRGGHAGYERLQLLARVRWPDTPALLQRAGVAAGMRCIDLGCGGGAVTLEIARMIAPDGHVSGIDMDDVKLDLAREAAVKRGLQNVEFRAMNLNEWHECDAYDVVFCRLMLQHLRHPVEILRRMWAAVRPGGVIIVEDPDFDGWCSHPPNAGFDFFLRAYSQAIAHWGGDHASGRKLYSYFLEADIAHPEVAVVQPVYLADDDGRTLALSTLEATGDAILDAGSASREELEVAVARLAEFTDDPGSLISGPRIFQLWARR